MSFIVRVISIVIVMSSMSVNAEEFLNGMQVDDTSKLKGLVAIGLTVGGDDLVTVEYTDGSSDEITAGALIDMKLGAIYKLANSPISIQTSIGYHFDRVDAENGDLSFNRIPVELLGFHNVEKHRIGAGFSYHLDPEIEIDALGSKVTGKLENALGLVVEYGYSFQKNFIMGLRYVDIEYEAEVDKSIKFDGSHFGIYGYLTF